MKIVAIISSLVIAASAWSLDTTEFDKKIKDLNGTDPKVRAAAIKEVAPLFADLLIGLQKARTDTNPEVVAAMQQLEKQIEAKTQKAPEIGIPRNEMVAAAVCKAYAEAQEIYHRTDYDNDGVLEYAQSIKGDNSLLEKKAGAADILLVDKSIADAEGAPGKATPKAGYLFKVLTKGDVNGVKRDYIRNGNMTLGYALIAFPAEYGKSGRNCFMISNAGTIFQCDLGAETHAIVEKMMEFKPDKPWVPTE